MMGTGYTGGQFGQWWNEGQWTWEKLFAWLPRQLESTGQWVWLTEVYLGERRISGPGTDVVLRKYLTPQEFTWHQLSQS